MASVDALILPSPSETLGLVLLEGMAAGTLVIGARAGGIPDVIHDRQTGFLFHPGRTGELISVVRHSVADPAEAAAVRLRGRKEAERWSWPAATRQLRQFYNQAAHMPRKIKKTAKLSWEQAVKKTAIGSIKLFLS